MGDQFHFHPDTYLDLVRSELHDYDRLQDEVARATRGLRTQVVLELGTGTGVTAQAVLAEHPGVHLTGIDESPAMLEQAKRDVASADFRVTRLQDPLPDRRFDLVFSALAVHHLDGPEKADLFRRVAALLAPGGRFVLGDVIVPEDPSDVVAPIEPEYDKPSSVAEQCRWLADAGLVINVAWVDRDLAVLVGQHVSASE